MNVPANPPMERSDVTVKGETTSVISGALATPGVSYCNRMDEGKYHAVRQPLTRTTIKLERYSPSATTTF